MNIEQIRRESLKYAAGDYRPSRKWNNSQIQPKPKKQSVALTPPPAGPRDGKATLRQVGYLKHLLQRKNLGVEYLRQGTGGTITTVEELTFKQAWKIIAILSKDCTELFPKLSKAERRRRKVERRRQPVADTRPVAAILKLWPKEALSRMADVDLVPWE